MADAAPTIVHLHVQSNVAHYLAWSIGRLEAAGRQDLIGVRILVQRAHVPALQADPDDAKLIQRPILTAPSRLDRSFRNARLF